MNEIYHHGIKGQKWGVRRYQFADGSLTPAGEKRYYINQNSNKVSRLSSLASMKVKDIANNARTQITGKQYVDSCLKKEPLSHEFRQVKTSRTLLSTLLI